MILQHCALLKQQQQKTFDRLQMDSADMVAPKLSKRWNSIYELGFIWLFSKVYKCK